MESQSSTTLTHNAISEIIIVTNLTIVADQTPITKYPYAVNEIIILNGHFTSHPVEDAIIIRNKKVTAFDQDR